MKRSLQLLSMLFLIGFTAVIFERTPASAPDQFFSGLFATLAWVCIPIIVANIVAARSSRREMQASMLLFGLGYTAWAGFRLFPSYSVYGEESFVSLLETPLLGSLGLLLALFLAGIAIGARRS